MFELNRFHSQALAQFGPRELAMSLLGGAGESRINALIISLLRGQRFLFELETSI